MKRNFNDWLAQFRSSIANYEYYTDFNKVFENVDVIKIELNIMNSLIGSKNIEADFDILLATMGHRTKRILRIERKEYQTY